MNWPLPDEVFNRAERLAVAATSDASLIPAYTAATKQAQSLEGAPGHKGNGRKMTQVEKILNHIEKTGSITQREAYLDYGIQSFTRRIADIRAMGQQIISVAKKHPTTGQEYTRYFTDPDLAAAQ